MNKLIILAALFAVAFARPEPPAPGGYSNSGYSNSGSTSFSSGGQDTNEGANIVDDALLARIAQILSQNNGGSSSSSSSYSAPAQTFSAPSDSYGAPPQQPSGGYGAPESRSSSGGVQLGKIEVAQRVAAFDLEDNSRAQQTSYSAPARNGGPY